MKAKLKKTLFSAAVSIVAVTVAQFTSHAQDSNPKDSGWTKPDKGIACRLTVKESTCSEAKPIAVEFQIKNVSDKPITVELPKQPAGTLTPFYFWLLHKTEKVKCDSPTDDGEPQFVTLQPDEVRVYAFSFGKTEKTPCVSSFNYDSAHFPFPSTENLLAGNYMLQVQYFGRRYGLTDDVRKRNQLLDDKKCWVGSLTTSPITIAVIPDTEIAKTVYGKPVDSLECILTLDKNSYAVGETVEMTRTIWNRALTEKKLYAFGYMNGNLRVHWINRDTGERNISGHMGCGLNSFTSVFCTAPLISKLKDDAITRMPGSYDVFISCRIPDGNKILVSNVVTITVKPK